MLLLTHCGAHFKDDAGREGGGGREERGRWKERGGMMERREES